MHFGTESVVGCCVAVVMCQVACFVPLLLQHRREGRQIVAAGGKVVKEDKGFWILMYVFGPIALPTILYWAYTDYRKELKKTKAKEALAAQEKTDTGAVRELLSMLRGCSCKSCADSYTKKMSPEGHPSGCVCVRCCDARLLVAAKRKEVREIQGLSSD